MKYRLPRKLKKAVKKCIIISTVDTNFKFTSVRTVGNIKYVGRHTKYTDKAIKYLKQRDYNTFHKQLVTTFRNLYAKCTSKEDLKFVENLYDWDIIIKEEN